MITPTLKRLNQMYRTKLRITTANYSDQISALVSHAIIVMAKPQEDCYNARGRTGWDYLYILDYSERTKESKSLRYAVKHQLKQMNEYLIQEYYQIVNRRNAKWLIKRTAQSQLKK